ncbi:MAG: swr complex subunit [Watsoniomyces obsoletus]|nr:MAG: swr complex subunit [Watsoniomyces obsoletus]
MASDQNPPAAAAAAENIDQRKDEEGDDYHSSEDEDFNPEIANVDGNVSESGGEDDGSWSGHKKRRKTTRNDDEGGYVSNSGDETIVRKGRKRRRGHDEGDNEEGGEGGLVKTRAQRAKEGKEKKVLADTSSATVDVDALWASMNLKSSKPTPGTKSSSDSHPGVTALTEQQALNEIIPKHGNPSTQKEPQVPTTTPQNKEENPEEEMITIKRTYDFAGETISEEKRVLKSSAEARLYLQSQSVSTPTPSTSAPTSSSTSKPLRRPKKRTSIFDPGPSVPFTKDSTSSIKKAGPSTKGGGTPGMKLNTIEKSKLDWAGFVDKEGINDELDEHSRAKEGYLGRMDFLNEVERKREDERLKKKGA